MTPAYVDSFRTFMVERGVARSPERRAEFEAQTAKMIEDAYLPPTRSEFARFALDDRDNLWVGEYRYELNFHESTTWLVLGRDGRHIATVRVPSGFWLMAVAGDRIYGWTRDSLDVRYGELRQLERAHVADDADEVVAYGVERK